LHKNLSVSVHVEQNCSFQRNVKIILFLKECFCFPPIPVPARNDNFELRVWSRGAHTFLACELQQTLVNPDLRQNRIKLVVRMISNLFLYKNVRFIRIF